jgi:hypothetical protein
MNVINQTQELLMACDQRARTDGIMLAEQVLLQSHEILDWLAWLREERYDAAVGEMLGGIRSSLLEVCSYVSVGLARSAILSMRTGIDLVLAYSYFSDHPAEWRHVNATGDGFMLKKDIEAFHQKYTSGYGRRGGVLTQAFGSRLGDSYRILSAHIHGQSTFTISNAGKFVDLVFNSEFMKSIVELHAIATVGMCDFLVSVYGHDPMAIPLSSRYRLQNTLTKGQYQSMFHY